MINAFDELNYLDRVITGQHGCQIRVSNAMSVNFKKSMFVCSLGHFLLMFMSIHYGQAV